MEHENLDRRRLTPDNYGKAATRYLHNSQYATSNIFPTGTSWPGARKAPTDDSQH